MANRFWSFAFSGAIGLISLVAPALAQELYYKNKTVRVWAAASAGGLYDTHARILARHIPKYIPGSPSIIVENVPGAGGLIAVNRLYKAVKPDGLTMGHFNGALARGQVLGNPGIEFDAVKFQWVGAPARGDKACVFTKASGITSMQAWMNSPKPVRIGATGPGSDLYDTPKVLEAALGLPIQLLAGYKGTSEIRLAAESKELDGVCWGSESVWREWPKALETGEVMVVLQIAPKALPYLPGVPLAIDFAKTQEARRLIEVGIHDMSSLFLTYALPPGTPKEPLQIMRQALMAALKDPELVADAKKSKMSIDPIPGEELEKIIAGLFKLDPAFVSKLKTILIPAN